MFGNKRNSKLLEALESEKPLAILFTGSPPPNRCGQRFVDPMPPVFNETSREFKDRVICAKVDIFKDTPFAHDFGIRTIPTVVFLRGRAEIERFEGPVSERTLLWYFERVMVPIAANDQTASQAGAEVDVEIEETIAPQPESTPRRRGFKSFFRK